MLVIYTNLTNFSADWASRCLNIKTKIKVFHSKVIFLHWSFLSFINLIDFGGNYYRSVFDINFKIMCCLSVMYRAYIARSDTTGKRPCSRPSKCCIHFVIGFNWLTKISANENSRNSRYVIKMPSSIAFVYRSFTRCTLTQKRTVCLLHVDPCYIVYKLVKSKTLRLLPLLFLSHRTKKLKTKFV